MTLSSEMTMKRKGIFTYRQRAFLNPASTDHDSFIRAIVANSDNGRDMCGTNMLTIADCYRRIRLEFFLGTKRERRRSLAKIDLLINVLTRFRDALKREADLIDKFK